MSSYLCEVFGLGRLGLPKKVDYKPWPKAFQYVLDGSVYKVKN